MSWSDRRSRRALSTDAFMPFAFNGEKWTVSMYSTTHDISDICKKYGGGGHAKAAGFTCVELPFMKG